MLRNRWKNVVRCGNKALAALLCAALLLAAIPAFAPPAAAASDGMVRVKISKLCAASVTFTATCAYYINANPAHEIAAGSSFTVSLSGGALQLSVGSDVRQMGASFQLARAKSGTYGAKSTSPAASNLMCGDLQFSIASSAVQTVLKIYVEDYLCGVVPYEMSNSYPLEALKAQAVAARNYVLRQKSARASMPYDVMDTSADQVYNGYVSSYSSAIRAVNETKGLVLYYGGSLASCFYSASNGGQTESTKNAWGSSLAYSVVKDDPYDLASGATSKAATINRDGTSLKAPLTSALIAAMAVQLDSAGLSSSEADVRIDEIVSILAHTPKYAAPSRLYTKLTFTMDVSSKDKNGDTARARVSADVNTYGGFEDWYSLGINTSGNETIEVSQTAAAFVITFRRWGHGIGMSQRGARVMADVHGLSYADILAFYYPGTSLTALSLVDSTGSTNASGSGGEAKEEQVDHAAVIGAARVALSSGSSSLNLRAAPLASGAVLAKMPHGAVVKVYAVSGSWAAVDYGGIKGYASAQYLQMLTSAEETPAPTQTAAQGDVYALLKLSSASGAMNVRKGPGTDTAIVTVIKHGAQVKVLATAGEWCNILTQSGHTGYVKAQYLVIIPAGESGEAEPTPTPEPSGLANGAYARLKLASSAGRMNVRKQPSTSSSVVTVISHGAYLKLLGESGEWSNVQTQSGHVGYVKTQYLVAVDSGDALSITPSASPAPSAAPTPAPTATAEAPSAGDEVYARVKLTGSGGSMNVRKSSSTSSSVVTTVSHGSYVQVLEQSGEWVNVRTRLGNVGYIKAKYLAPAAKAEVMEAWAAAGAVSKGGSSSGSAVVEKTLEAVTTANVNLRRQASTSSESLGVLSAGTAVTVTAYDDTWAYVLYGEKKGYIARKYLKAV